MNILLTSSATNYAPYLLAGAALLTSIWTVFRGRIEVKDTGARTALEGQQNLITDLQYEVKRLRKDYEDCDKARRKMERNERLNREEIRLLKMERGYRQ